IVEWCERNDVTVSSYQYHARKLRRIGLYPTNPECMKSNGAAVNKPDRKNSVTFAELLPPSGGSSTAPLAGIPEITVEYGKFRINVSGNANKETLEKVMEVVTRVG
ncbi:MAG: hypothetical protein IIY58_01075, partial [Aeriscardovia sp.]|nr:hypothetical protein [Aeriscardovia sp.]